jgi:hypothetical protein
MAGIRYTPTISTADIGWLGEAPNYKTLMPHGAMADPTAFDPVDKVTLTTSGSTAASSKVINLTGKINNSVGIPSGTVLTFGAVNVTTSAWVSPEAASIPVFPTSAIIADATAYNYPGYGARPIRSGTVVGRTYAERDTGVPFGLAVDADDEIYFVAFDVPDVLKSTEIVLVRYQVRIKENRVPGWAALSATIKTKLRTLYQMYRGT